MKMMNCIYYLGALILLVITSCTKVIDLKLGNDTGQLVIEGNITDQRAVGPQTIKLSQNVPFTAQNLYPPVSGATVSVHDNLGNTYNFTEQDPGTYLYYGLSGAKGVTYTLSVTTNGKNYMASSTMPQKVFMDSITSSNEITKGNNKKIITVYFADPPNIANQYRFVMFVNGLQVNNIFAFNDAFSNGRYVHLDLRPSDVTISSGDRVTVDMECIDKPIYTYWFALLQQQNNGFGGGVTPSNPPSNITPAALGYFSAHTSQGISLVVR